MEFRLYDKVNCSIFDLIGSLEPDQTKSLGLLFANSEGTLNVFLSLIGMAVKQANKYVVDCEPRNIAQKRFDILVRFYHNNIPLEALIIEAKSVNLSHASQKAIIQLVNYSGFNHLIGFNKQTSVIITRDTELFQKSGVISITWSQFISALHAYAIKAKDEMAFNYVKYIMSIQGNMNYYEEDILSIPASRSLPAILKSGIYECPTTGRRYAHQRKTLYIAFKDQGGVMRTLYKLKDVIEGVDLNDTSQIDVLESMEGLKGISQRINEYKTTLPYDSNDHIPKRLFVLDMDNSITLPHIVRPLENNSNWPYYSLKDFLQPVNSNKGQVILQDNISIIGNELIVKANGKKQYDLFESGLLVNSFMSNGKYILNISRNYTINVKGVNRGGHRCTIQISYNNNKWSLYFQF
jgi:hypothetical protein